MAWAAVFGNIATLGDITFDLNMLIWYIILLSWYVVGVTVTRILYRLALASGIVLGLAGCAQAQISPSPAPPGAAKHLIMRDMVPRIGAFGILADKATQDFFRRTNAPRQDEAMRVLTWAASREPAGTFVVWSGTVPGLWFVPTLIIEVNGVIPGSAGCRSIAWAGIQDVVDQQAMLKTMDGSRGDLPYFSYLADHFAARKRASYANFIIDCPTADPAAVDLYGIDHVPITHANAHDPNQYLYAGTVRVDAAATKQWLTAEQDAGRFIVKAAKPPADFLWWGPFPEPAAHKKQREGVAAAK